MKQTKYARVAGELVRFSLPLIMSGILQQLYSWADAFIIGHAEGQMQLAAVGATTTASMFLTNTILGLTLGLSIMAAQHVGQGDQSRIRDTIHAFLPLMVGLYALLAAAAAFFLEPILSFLGTPAEIFADALSYLRILLLGIPFLACYNLYAALLRALGNTKAAFYAVLISSALNVALDILLVAVLPFGVAGAAAATVLSQIGMTAFIVLYSAHKYPGLLRLSNARQTDFSVIRQGLRFSAPPALKNSITSLGSLALQGFMNSFGAVTVLAVTTAYRVDCITMLPIINLGAAVSIMTAHAKGAGDHQKIRETLLTGLALMMIISSLLAAAMYALGAAFVAFFGVSGEALLKGKVFFQDMSVFYPIFGLSIVLQSVLEGMGDITLCSVIGVGALGLRIALSFLLRPYFADRTIALAEGFTWAAMLLVFAARMATRRRQIMEK